MEMNVASIRLLHVDDEPEFADLAADFIQREDERFTIETATDASEGLEKLSRQDFDCIVSDYDMPGQDGIEFLEAVRTEHPNLPFILYTGKGSEEIASEAISSGVTDYLQKGTGTSQYQVLVNRIENAVGQRRAQQEAAETEQRLQTIAEKTNDILWQFTAEWDELLFINSPYETVWGRSVEELQAEPRSFLEGIHPDDQPAVEQAMAELSSGESSDIEFRLTPADDALRWIWAQGEPVFDTAGEVEKVVGFARDITERKQREIELNRSEERYRRLLETSPNPVLITDRTAEILYVNASGIEFLGASDRDELIGRNASEFIHPDYREEIQQRRSQLLEDGEGVPAMEQPVVDLAGREKHAIVSSAPVTFEGKPAVQTVATDITERKEQSRRFEALIDQSMDVISIIDDEGVITYQSPSVERILGYEPEELIGENGFDYIHPADREEVQALFNEVVNQPGMAAERATYRFRHADGSWVWLETNGRHEERSGIEGYVLNSRDITDRKEREDELRQLKEEYETVFNTAQDGIFLFDVEHTASDVEFKLRTLNPAHEAISGLSSEDDRGKTPVELLGEELGSQVAANYRRCVEAKEPISYEEVLEMPSGTISWRTNLAPVVRDGEVVQLVGVAREVTERKTRERELQRYETLAEVAGDPIYMLDAEGHIEYVNEEFIQLSGYPEAALLGEHIGKVMQEADLQRAEDLIRSLLRSGDRQGTFEMEAVTADGGRIPAENNITLLLEDGEFRGSIGVMRVIGERLARRERLKHERDRLEEFAKVLSHDLRNPLNVAVGRLQMVREDCESPHLDAVESAQSRMKSMIDDMLSLANAGETLGEPEAVELPTLGRVAWQNVETPSAELDIETDRTIQADRSRLQQLLENLLRNAVEHGGAAVTVTVGDLPDGFYVEDDGSGIPAEDRDEVFEAGYSTTEHGTGFGLNIVREIAVAHGWDIRVGDSRDGGARFEFLGVDRA